MQAIRPIFIPLLALMLGQTALVAASTDQFSCGTPSDFYGRSIPTPTGNIGFVAVPGGMCGGSAEFTWDYAGTLVDGESKYSFMAEIMQLERFEENCNDGNCGAYSVGIHGLQFAFKDAVSTYYLNSTFGGDSSSTALTALLNSLDWVYSSSSLEKFELETSLMLPEDGNKQWSITTTGTTPISPLYIGLTGQPGQSLAMRGEGQGFLWKIESDGRKSVALYDYSLEIDFTDERGIVAQGYGGGYVGPALVQDGEPLPAESGISEYEIAQPRLKVSAWRVSMQAADQTVMGFRRLYEFAGTDGMLWNDLGPVKETSLTPDMQLMVKDQAPSVSQSLQPQQLARRFLPTVKSKVAAHKSLYHGNWLPIQFTQGKYAGTSIVFNVYWNQYIQRSPDQTTDSFAWSRAGFGGIFTGILADNVTSAYSFTELMLPGLPRISEQDPHEAGWLNPFEVRFLEYVDEKYDPAYPWVTKLRITIRARSRLRLALASYANLRSGRWNEPVDSGESDLIITITSLFPEIQNTMFTSQTAQYYESAASVEIDGLDVGYAWIEHMGQPN
ncbi:hypothetical protein CCR91_14700 [Thiorhodovibrio winogradskyi]|nr:hypothetical protein [Thiorhodovibrio winogradskyi]